MEHKYIIFVWIPKCAGSAIYDYYNLFPAHLITHKLFPEIKYFDNNSHVTTGHCDINMLNKIGISKNFYDKNFKFCIVRNPYDRAVSLFHYNRPSIELSHGKSYTFKKWIKYLFKNINNIPKNSIYNSSLHNTSGVDSGINNQWNSMISWIPSDIDKIYFFEDGIDTIINDINKRLNLIKNIKNIKKINTTNHTNYTEYYDEETRKLVYEIYKEDFIQFNYLVELHNKKTK